MLGCAARARQFRQSRQSKKFLSQFENSSIKVVCIGRAGRKAAAIAAKTTTAAHRATTAAAAATTNKEELCYLKVLQDFVMSHQNFLDKF